VTSSEERQTQAAFTCGINCKQFLQQVDTRYRYRYMTIARGTQYFDLTCPCQASWRGSRQKWLIWNS